MSDISNLDALLERVMQVQVAYMGGAAAGILGIRDSDDDLVHALKRAAIGFARQYRNPRPDGTAVRRAADDVIGIIHSLRVVSTLSAEKADSLIAEVEQLVKAFPL